jgi:hypothetical protein
LRAQEVLQEEKEERVRRVGWSEGAGGALAVRAALTGEAYRWSWRCWCAWRQTMMNTKMTMMTKTTTSMMAATTTAMMVAKARRDGKLLATSVKEE